MRAFSLMYHDVVDAGGEAASGIQGADADLYKLPRAEFQAQLDALRKAQVTVSLCTEPQGASTPVFLTFDDGGASFCWIAAELERRGWRGHFFITTDWIGKSGFVSEPEIRRMAEAGHVIGSHSASHPRRISSLPPKEIAREWETSVARLSQIVGRPVEVASVPGGFYSREVASAAAAAGVRMLFTSEPRENSWQEGNCLLLGRYFLQRGMGVETALSFAGGAGGARFRQRVLWDMKKAAKSLGGGLYLRARAAWLGRSSSR